MANIANTWVWCKAAEEISSASELLVLAYLADRADTKTLTCWPKIETIARATGRSASTVAKALNALEQRGLISRTRSWAVKWEGEAYRTHQAANTYQLLLPPDFAPPASSEDTPLPMRSIALAASREAHMSETINALRDENRALRARMGHQEVSTPAQRIGVDVAITYYAHGGWTLTLPLSSSELDAIKAMQTWLTPTRAPAPADASFFPHDAYTLEGLDATHSMLPARAKTPVSCAKTPVSTPIITDRTPSNPTPPPYLPRKAQRRRNKPKTGAGGGRHRGLTQRQLEHVEACLPKDWMPLLPARSIALIYPRLRELTNSGWRPPQIKALLAASAPLPDRMRAPHGVVRYRIDQTFTGLMPPATRDHTRAQAISHHHHALEGKINQAQQAKDKAWRVTNPRQAAHRDAHEAAWDYLTNHEGAHPAKAYRLLNARWRKWATTHAETRKDLARSYWMLDELQAASQPRAHDLAHTLNAAINALEEEEKR